jgi:hypothetical protein
VNDTSTQRLGIVGFKADKHEFDQFEILRQMKKGEKGIRRHIHHLAGTYHICQRKPFHVEDNATCFDRLVYNHMSAFHNKQDYYPHHFRVLIFFSMEAGVGEAV